MFEGGKRTTRVRGIDTYVLKNNNFGNTYTLNIKNEDRDNVKLYYQVKNVDTGDVVHEGSSIVSKNASKHNFRVNYYQMGEALRGWKDGVYEVEVRGVDYEDGLDHGVDFLSEDIQKVYIIIKKNAPPVPKIKFNKSSREVTIDYPADGGEGSLFRDPEIVKYYRKEYRVSGELEEYLGKFTVDRNCTVYAVYTDIAGNVSKSSINIVVGSETRDDIEKGKN